MSFFFDNNRGRTQHFKAAETGIDPLVHQHFKRDLADLGHAVVDDVAGVGLAGHHQQDAGVRAVKPGGGKSF